MTELISLTGQSQASGLSFGEPEEREVKTLFFYDDYADDTPKVIGVTATTGEITTDTGTQGVVTPFSGTKMLKVQDADAATNQVYYQFGRFADGKIGIKLRWFKNSDTSDFIIEINHHDKVTKETYKVKFVEASMKWQYWNSSGTYADISNGSENIADNTWNEVTLVIDLTNVKYGRLITNGLNLDLSTLSAQSAADTSTEGKTKIIFGATTGASNKASYLDEFLVYRNET